jgi:hypothetical protein
LHELFVCKFFSNVNHSMSSKPLSLLPNNQSNRTFEKWKIAHILPSLWIPLMIDKNATTKSMHVPVQDDYRDYLPLSLLITVRTTESQFYIQNEQKPIARKFEVFFFKMFSFLVSLSNSLN